MPHAHSRCTRIGAWGAIIRLFDVNGDGWTQNFAGFIMIPLGSMAVLRPQDDEREAHSDVPLALPVHPARCFERTGYPNASHWLL